jgi:hypothetical protein
MCTMPLARGVNFIISASYFFLLRPILAFEHFNSEVPVVDDFPKPVQAEPFHIITPRTRHTSLHDNYRSGILTYQKQNLFFGPVVPSTFRNKLAHCLSISYVSVLLSKTSDFR